jgi:hypothetical protein
MPDRISWLALAAGAAISLWTCYEISSLTLVLGSHPAGWQYGYIRDPSLRPLGAALLASGIAAGLLLLPRHPARYDRLVVLVWIAAATLLHGLIRSLTPFSLESIFRSDAANSFYSVTQQYDVRQVLGAFEELRSQWAPHAQSNMPGKLVLLYALEIFTQRPAALAWLVVVVSNLGALLMYMLVRDLFGDRRVQEDPAYADRRGQGDPADMNRRVALYAAVLYLFVPGKLLFFPVLNTVTPVPTLAAACVLVRWLTSGKAAYAALFGVVIYVLVLFEPLPLVVGLLFAGLVARTLALDGMRVRQMAVHMVVGGTTFAATALAVRWRLGFDLFAAFTQLKAEAIQFNVTAGRAYGFWIRHNLHEFVFSAGPCQIVLFGAALASGLRTAGGWRARLTEPVTVVCLGLLAVLIAVDLIGINRGEVVRLWIFLACLAQIPAAYVCARLPGPIGAIVVVSLSCLQAALGTATIGFIVLR